MNATHNGTVTWRGLLQWLDAQGGEATLQRALAVWGHKLCVDANVAGDVSAPWSEMGLPSVLRLTEQGRSKL